MTDFDALLLSVLFVIVLAAGLACTGFLKITVGKGRVR